MAHIWRTGFRDAEGGPEERLALGAGVGVESEKVQELLPRFLKLASLFRGENPKPGAEPTRRDDSMAEIAERDHVLGNVRTALRARNNVVPVEHAIGIALAIGADLAL